MSEVVGAIREYTDGATVVDSSKTVGDALLLAWFTPRRVEAVHLVRDPRAVAYSWGRAKFDPSSGEPMGSFSPVASTARWLEWNAAIDHYLPTSVPTLRLRYEDLVAAPRAVLTSAGLSSAGAFQDELTVRDLRGAGAHTVAGNPDRFCSGPVEFRSDDRWLADMALTDRLGATLAALPLLRRYGYPIWPS